MTARSPSGYGTHMPDPILDETTGLTVHRHGPTPDVAPTLLLLHGLTDSGEGWPEAVRHWQDRWAIVAPDQRGHGQSPRFTQEQLGRHPGEVMVEDAVALLEALPTPPVVVGHSLGGAVAWTVAVRRPELVRGVVLEDPAPLGPDEPQADPAHGTAFLEGVERSRSAPDDETLLRQRREDHPDWPESELLVTGRAEQQMDLDYLARGDLKPSERWPELVDGVRVPMLVLTGDSMDEVCVDRRMEDALRAADGVEVLRIPGAGHCVRREQPEAYYQAVDRWLAALP